MDAHFAVSLQIQHPRHAHVRRLAGSAQKWQKGVGVALTVIRAGADADEGQLTRAIRAARAAAS
jgi:hypothetical protein